MKTFPLTISAIDQVLFKGRVDSVTCPGGEGELTVLKDHEPLITSLIKGTIVVREKEERKDFLIESGFLLVDKGETIILI